jgi:hypothetical protein
VGIPFRMSDKSFICGNAVRHKDGIRVTHEPFSPSINAAAGKTIEQVFAIRDGSE